MSVGSLVIVGIGIKFAAHITVEAHTHICEADRVLYLSYWPETSEWMNQLNPNATDLASLYAVSKPRLESYQQMTNLILADVRKGMRVCAVFYGHPGVFVRPSIDAARQARAEGFSVEILPGISAEDCLFADLGFDPAQIGCQSFEATDFLIRTRHIDPSIPMILWQIGVIGYMNAPKAGMSSPGIKILIEQLAKIYGEDHDVLIYEAARYPNHSPLIQQLALSAVSKARISPVSTMFIPNRLLPEIDENMVDRLGLSIDDFRILKYSSGRKR